MALLQIIHFSTNAGDKEVRVSQTGHGLSVGDKVTFSAATALAGGGYERYVYVLR